MNNTAILAAGLRLKLKRENYKFTGNAFNSENKMALQKTQGTGDEFYN